MKIRMPIWLPVAFFSMLASGCVSQADFDKEIAKSRKVEAILLCETKVDVYEELLDSDEPNPTRRDEPTATRRDLASCEAEYGKITDGNVQACRPSMLTCVNDTALGMQQCRSCYTECLGDATWDNAACPLP